MAVKFKPKPGKPHIKLRTVNNKSWILNPATDACITNKEIYLHRLAYDYCVRVNPYYGETKGEAARALHYGSEK